MNAEQLALKRVLIVRSSTRDYQPLLKAFGPSCAAEVVDSFDEALERLSKQQFDAVLSDTSAFIPMERALVAQQASTILQAIGQCVCIGHPETQFGFELRCFQFLVDCCT